MDSSSFQDKSINVKKDNGFSSRRLRREISVINSSLEDYGRSNIGVAFTWESQPGTPKVKYNDRPLPPITPPPSFIYSSKSKKPLKNPSKTNILTSFLSKFILRRTSRTRPSPVSSFSSSSSRSSSCSVSGSPFTPSYRRGRATQSSTRWNFSEEECESPISALCFGARESLSGGPQRGSPKTMKILLRGLA